MTIRIASVVEGHGEVQAIPILIRRIAMTRGVFDISIRTPHRIGRPHMTSPKVAAAVRMQRLAVGEDGIVIVVYDSDDDDPAVASRETESQLDNSSCRATVLVAVREYEAWLLAGIQSLRNSHLIKGDASFAGDPELPRNAAGKLRELMTESYKKTVHQASLTAHLDLDEAASKSPSFKRFLEAMTSALESAGRL